MAVTVDSFKARFPEFKGSRVELAAALAQIELRVSETFGALRDEVVMLELADTLTGSPDGRRARKVDPGRAAGSVYRQKLDELRRIHAATRRVSGCSG